MMRLEPPQSQRSFVWIRLSAEEGKLGDLTFQSTSKEQQKEAAYLGLPRGDVAAADGGGDDLDADLQGPRRGHLHLLHHQRLPRPPRHRRCAQATQLYAALQVAGIQSKGNWAKTSPREKPGWVGSYLGR